MLLSHHFWGQCSTFSVFCDSLVSQRRHVTRCLGIQGVIINSVYCLLLTANDLPGGTKVRMTRTCCCGTHMSGHNYDVYISGHEKDVAYLFVLLPTLMGAIYTVMDPFTSSWIAASNTCMSQQVQSKRYI